MDILYCHKCGHRVSKAEIESGAAHMDAMRAICAKCAEPETAAMAAALPRPAARKTVTIQRPDAPPRAKAAVSGNVEVKQTRSTTTLLFACGGAMALLGLAAIFLLGHAKRKESGNDAGVRPTAEQAASKPVLETRNLTMDGKDGKIKAAEIGGKGSNERGETPLASVPVPPSSADPVSPSIQAPPAASTKTIDEEADKHFDIMKGKLAALPADAKAEKIAMLEEFLKNYGETFIAARARGELRKLTHPMPAPGAGPGDPPPSHPDMKALASLNLNQFKGGEFYPGFQGKGVDGRAIWGSKSPQPVMEAVIPLAAAPTRATLLDIYSLKHALNDAASIRISINGKVVYEGRDKNNEGRWAISYYELPAGTLVAGENSIVIACTEDSANFHFDPWFMLNRLTIYEDVPK